jgi:hypothetical protein
MRNISFKSGTLRKNATWITVYDEQGQELGSIGTEAYQKFSDGQVRIVTLWHPKNLRLGRYLKEDEKCLCDETVLPPEAEKA